MKKLIHPCRIKGVIEAAASKSFAQRAIAAAMLSNGDSILRNYTACNDTEAAISIAQKFGASIRRDGTSLFINGDFKSTENYINCGESGLGIRMFTPIFSLLNHEILVTGEGSLKSRPVDLLEKPLNDFGAYCKTTNGLLPICVKGPLKGGVSEIDGSLSSQVLTGLLMSLPLADNDSEIKVWNLKSKPYIDITISVLESFGVEVFNENYSNFKIKGKQKYKPTDFLIEGDWSGAAFFLIAGALGGEVNVRSLKAKSFQADIEILKALYSVGAIIDEKPDSISVRKNQMKPFEFDAAHCPDLFPPLVALASHCDGVTQVKGVGRLIHKESNRALVLQKEFKKLGVQIDIDSDIMKIYGGKVNGGKIHSNNDHRIAMAAATAAILASGPIEIENSESINKSYPSFFEDFNQIVINS